MSRVKVAAFSVSLDGYGAGPDQSREEPLGKRGEELHEWIFPTKMFKKIYGKGEGTQGTDNDFAEKSFETLARGSWGAICSGLFAGRGQMMIGKVGGAKTHPIMFLSLC
jgi:hypothetical protein